jgi:hypothetical protein
MRPLNLPSNFSFFKTTTSYFSLSVPFVQILTDSIDCKTIYGGLADAEVSDINPNFTIKAFDMSGKEFSNTVNAI